MNNQQIRGNTRLIALLGNPVAHSLSPQIHNHALAALKLPYAYIPLGEKPDDLPGVVGTLRACGFLGANVTIPHKQQVLGLCDAVSDLSKTIGAVNTLYFREGVLHGTTTDPVGFFRALAWMGCDPAGRDVVVLGNGGTARTLAFALALEKKPSSLTLVGRDAARVGPLAAEITAQTGVTVTHSTFSSSGLPRVMDACTLCVNCTSAGMHPHRESTPLPAELFHKGMTVFDTIYNPSRTRFLADAEGAGCVIQNGLRMLLYQGLESLRLWTGVDVPESLFDLSELERAISG